MNIFTKALLGSTLILGSIFGSVSPAEAGTCWFRQGYNHTANAEYCGTNRRINNNGHIVFDVVDTNGKGVTIVMWDDNTAELIGLASYPIEVPFYKDSDGDHRFVLRNGAEFIVRF